LGAPPATFREGGEREVSKAAKKSQCSTFESTAKVSWVGTTGERTQEPEKTGRGGATNLTKKVPPTG